MNDRARPRPYGSISGAKSRPRKSRTDWMPFAAAGCPWTPGSTFRECSPPQMTCPYHYTARKTAPSTTQRPYCLMSWIMAS